MIFVSRHLLVIAMAFVLLVSESTADLRIATYNIYNYLVMDRRVDDRWRPNYPKPEREKAIIQQVILDTRPDILALQEIGPPEFLEELRLDLKDAGLHYPHSIHLSGPDPVRHLAVLSKVPPVDVMKHTDLDFKYLDRRELVKRGLLEVEFEDGAGERFKLFVVHLKSKLTVDREDPQSQLRRTREAEACRNRVIERTLELGFDRFLVCGDFNDHPDSGPLRRFYRRGDLEFGKLVPATDSRGEVWTHFFERRGLYSLIDAFVASHAIWPDIKDGRGHIVDTPGVLQGSDHRMVYLDLVSESD